MINFKYKNLLFFICMSVVYYVFKIIERFYLFFFIIEGFIVMFEYIENKIKKKNIYILKVGIFGLDVYMDNIFKNYDLRKI